MTRRLIVLLPLVIGLLAGATVTSAKLLAHNHTIPANMGLIFQNIQDNSWYWMQPDGTDLERYWLVDMQTQMMTTLSVPTSTQKRFVWSPDSQYVAYMQNGFIELIDIDSGMQTTLVNMQNVSGSTGSSSSLAWSPDSRQLVFDYTTANASPYRAISSSYSLWMVNIDGTGLHRISIEGAALNPVWDRQTNDLYYVCRHLFSEVCAMDMARGISIRVPLPDDLIQTLDDFIVSLRDVYGDGLILGDVLPNADLYLYNVSSGTFILLPQNDTYTIGRIYWFAHP
jgi:hypothetical protein